MQRNQAMAKKNETRKDSKKLRPLATDDLKAVVGGAVSAPGNYGAKSSGGGGTTA